MALEVEWTKNALQDYRLVVEYLLQNWSVNIATHVFTIRFQKNLLLSLLYLTPDRTLQRTSTSSII
jgi:hypothetical protein